MGETYRTEMAITEALYNEAWKMADEEAERYGTISRGTLDRLADLELELSLMEVGR